VIPGCPEWSSAARHASCCPRARIAIDSRVLAAYIFHAIRAVEKGGKMNSAEPEFVNLPGFTGFEPLWAEFRRRHSRWLTERLSEKDVVYRLPHGVLDLLEANLQLDADDMAAELAFDQLCLRFRAVGVWNNRPILYRWLLPAPASVPESQVEAMRLPGWTREQVRKVRGMLRLMDGVSRRLQSVAGRRICNPKFLDERDRAHKAWDSLADAERPHLPLSRTPRFQEIDDCLGAKCATKALAYFMSDFDYFCDQWGLTDMATWDLPEPGGLMWPDHSSRSRSRHTEAVIFRSPVDFPILDSDGLGTIARDQHSASAQEVGISDLKRWETYARLLEIDHWERVLATRYADRARPRNSVTFIEATIARLIHRDAERVHKLRKQLRGLKSGRRNKLSTSR
jgi:hypothetical protein